MEYASNHSQQRFWSEISEPASDWESWRNVSLRALEGFVAVAIALVVIVFVAV